MKLGRTLHTLSQAIPTQASTIPNPRSKARILKTAASNTLALPRPKTGFFSSIGSMFQKIGKSVQKATRLIGSAVSFGVQISHSLFYRGATLAPGEIRKAPKQTGPKGQKVAIDTQAFAQAEMGADVSKIAQALLEQNAPIVRQFKKDSYPLSTEDLLGNSERKADGTYDVKDRFADSAKATQKFTPKTYASAIKVNESLIKLTYTRQYANSYQPTGNARRLPGTPEHEGDVETCAFYYDVTKGEIVGANVAKHGEGGDILYPQSQIEFQNGRAVVNTAFGSHATNLTSGMERTDTRLSHDLHKWTGRWMLDHYPGEADVKKGKAVELHFAPQDVIVVGVETAGSVTFGERERWIGSVDGTRRMGASTFTLPTLLSAEPQFLARDLPKK